MARREGRSHISPQGSVLRYVGVVLGMDVPFAETSVTWIEGAKGLGDAGAASRELRGSGTALGDSRLLIGPAVST